MTVDQCVRWEDHISNLCARIRKLFFIFKKLREILSQRQLITYYYALVQSLLTYGILAWGGASNYLITNVEIAQKIMLKIIFSVPLRFPTDALFDLTEVFCFRRLYTFEIIKFLSRNPTMLEFAEHGYVTRSTSQNIARPIKHHKQHTKKFFVAYIHRIHNSFIQFLHVTDRTNTTAYSNSCIRQWLKSISNTEMDNLYREII